MKLCEVHDEEMIQLNYVKSAILCILVGFVSIIFRYRIYLVIRWSFSFQSNPKDLDPSCKTDLDLWDRLGRVKLVLLQNFIEEHKPRLIAG